MILPCLYTFTDFVLSTLTFSLDLADDSNFWKINTIQNNSIKNNFKLNIELLEEIESVDDRHPYLTDHQYQLRLHTLFLQLLGLSEMKQIKSIIIIR